MASDSEHDKDTPVTLLLKELAIQTGAVIRGDETLAIHGIATLDSATEGDLCFVTEEKYLPKLERCQASVVVLKPEYQGSFAGTVLLHDNPYYIYARASQHFSPYPAIQQGIHPTAVVHESVTLGKGVSIAAQAVVEQGVSIGDYCVIGAGSVVGAGTKLGDNTQIRANVTLHAQSQIGERCIIHSGVVIGDDGFGFAPHEEQWERIVQMGNVRIGDDVEIGANTTIDRAALSSTVIGNGVKIDNLVQIGHNVEIGDNTIIVACCGIGGSTKIGKNCKIGGATGMAGHLDIADGVMITGMSQVTGSLRKPYTSYSSGTGISETGLWRRNVVRFKQLSELTTTVKKLQKQVKKLIENTDGRES